jgi:hypothetical protein
MAITGGSEDGPMRFPTPISDITDGLYFFTKYHITFADLLSSRSQST